MLREQELGALHDRFHDAESMPRPGSGSSMTEAALVGAPTLKSMRGGRRELDVLVERLEVRSRTSSPMKNCSSVMLPAIRS